jgi:imidazoleglycerol-phosphate dehydratase/histidinol-phosphatase
MYKLNIDKSYFDFNSPKSKGLISGLKKLTGKGFYFYSDGINSKTNSSLQKILKSENISFKNKSIKSFIKEFSIKKEKTFESAVEKILSQLRTSSQNRKTKETDIKINLSLDGKGKSKISTGIGFFDHMLEQIARHANIVLNISVKGDLHIDEHHTVEDVGITLGNALAEALGDKKGIKRYGFYLPMDDAVAVCAVDLGGRHYLNFNCKFNREKVGEFPTELTEEFFRGLSSGLKANIFIKANGKNDHHKIEAIFKSFAKALNEACRFDERNEGALPSTKGIL